jgi:hypothetical protein
MSTRMPSFDVAALTRTHAWEYGLRFLFGGAVTVATGLIANAYGPTVGGLFLAFPAILPASLTLLKRHDGRAEAARAAVGGRIGALGLIAFAGVSAVLATHHGAPLTLAAASLTWAAVSVGLWFAIYRPRERAARSGPARIRRARRRIATRPTRRDARERL